MSLGSHCPDGEVVKRCGLFIKKDALDCKCHYLTQSGLKIRLDRRDRRRKSKVWLSCSTMSWKPRLFSSFHSSILSIYMVPSLQAYYCVTAPNRKTWAGFSWFVFVFIKEKRYFPVGISYISLSRIGPNAPILQQFLGNRNTVSVVSLG